jgi:hypothetical protein
METMEGCSDFPNADTNLINSRTVIPTIKGRLNKGKHFLGCAVLGEIHKEN